VYLLFPKSTIVQPLPVGVVIKENATGISSVTTTFVLAAPLAVPIFETTRV